MGAGIYKSAAEAFEKRSAQGLAEPTDEARYDELYLQWKAILQEKLAEESNTPVDKLLNG
jgi:hypothetical protein